MKLIYKLNKVIRFYIKFKNEYILKGIIFLLENIIRLYEKAEYHFQIIGVIIIGGTKEI